MSPQLVTAIVQAAVELSYAGINISQMIQETRSNGGKLSDETLKQIEQEVASANELWTEGGSGTGRS